MSAAVARFFEIIGMLCVAATLAFMLIAVAAPTIPSKREDEVCPAQFARGEDDTFGRWMVAELDGGHIDFTDSIDEVLELPWIHAFGGDPSVIIQPHGRRSVWIEKAPNHRFAVATITDVKGRANSEVWR